MLLYSAYLEEQTTSICVVAITHHKTEKIQWPNIFLHFFPQMQNITNITEHKAPGIVFQGIQPFRSTCTDKLHMVVYVLSHSQYGIHSAAIFWAVVGIWWQIPF